MQYKQIISEHVLGMNEKHAHSVSMIMENTSASNAGAYMPVAFPIIKRVYNDIVTKHMVSYKEIDKPHTRIVYFVPKVTSRIDDEGTFKHPSPHSDYFNECVGANCPKEFSDSCKSYYDQLYNDEFFDQTKGAYNVITATGEPFSFDSDGCIVDYSGETQNDGSIRKIKFSVGGLQTPQLKNLLPINGSRGVEVNVEEFLSTFKVVNIGSPINDLHGELMYATGDEVQFSFVAQKYAQTISNYNELCSPDGELLIELDLTKPITATGEDITIDGYIGIDPSTDVSANFAFSWKRYLSTEFSPNISETSYDARWADLSVVDRKSRANYSIELEQDLKAYYDKTATDELKETTAQQIALEIDREILRDLKAVAPFFLRHDYYGWRNSTVFNNQITWNQQLLIKIDEISAGIGKSTGCGGANWIVFSPETFAAIASLSNFVPFEIDEEYEQINGIKRVGTLNGLYTVYFDGMSKPNDILIGYKPKGLINPGYLLSPYSIAQPLGPAIDPATLQPTLGFMSRYAKKVIQSRMYGRIYVDNIPVFDTRPLR